MLAGLVSLQSLLPLRGAEPAGDKAYIALEGEGAVAVLDTQTNRIAKKIDLTDARTGMRYDPHNVQAAPDGSYI